MKMTLIYQQLSNLGLASYEQTIFFSFPFLNKVTILHSLFSVVVSAYALAFTA